MITENLKDFKINKLTQEQYDRALAAGEINENELYMTESSEGGGDYLPLSGGVIRGDVTVVPTEESSGQFNLIGIIDNINSPAEEANIKVGVPPITIGYIYASEENDGYSSATNNGAQINYGTDLYDKDTETYYPASLQLMISGGLVENYSGLGNLYFETVPRPLDDISGDINYSNIRINGVANPLEDYDAVNKKYVDDLMKVDTATEV